VPVHALRGVSLEVGAGEICCILGRSGSGKSSLLHVLGALERPTRGQVRVNGVELSTASEQERVKLRREHVGFVFQDGALLDHLTAEENVALPLRYAGVGAPQRQARAREILEKLGLGARLGFTPAQLSGGERQRVSVARALVGSRTLLLADEPTGELDTATAAEVASLLVQVNRDLGVTVVIVTHDREMAGLASRHMEMVDGSLRRIL